METSRRSLFGLTAAAGLSTTGMAPFGAHTFSEAGKRSYWLSAMDKIARPVLSNLAQGKLRAVMPVEQKAGLPAHIDRRTVTYLEAFGRLMCGIAPWLALKTVSGTEGALQQAYIGWAQTSLERAVNPASPDFMNFTKERQPLVDAAFLAQAIVRAPDVLWTPLPRGLKDQLIAAMESTRQIANPHRNNWVMFAAMVETFLMLAGRPTQNERFERNIAVMLNWYIGDGTYGDGPDYHADYYNSFVIQPMLVDCLNVLQHRDARYKDAFDKVMIRSVRQAEIQERMIGIDGSFPPLGRSIVYRAGAFHTLAQMALMEQLPERVSPAQVREALGAVFHRTLSPEGTFTPDGWLQIGLAGHQPDLGEDYISTGSLYLAALGFLPLGLTEAQAFWRNPAQDWTARKVWSGLNQPADKALKDERAINLPQ
ncbi:MAG: DUF2264 domain-containing protein [Asticcacaulis sp.]